MTGSRSNGRGEQRKGRDNAGDCHGEGPMGAAQGGLISLTDKDGDQWEMRNEEGAG